MGAPKTTAVTAPPQLAAKLLPRRTPGPELPHHCPETLRQAVARVGRLAEGLRRDEGGMARGTYLANQVAACLAAWLSEEIPAALAVTVLDGLHRAARNDAARLPPSR